MSDEPKPLTDDEERLQRYLEWRERAELPTRRAARRRRLCGALAGGAVGVVGVAVLAWVSYGPRPATPIAREDAPSAAVTRPADVAGVTHPADTTRAADAAAAASPPPVIDRAPEAAAPPAPAIRRRARADARTAARAAPPERRRPAPAEESTAPPSAAFADRAPASDLAATAATPVPALNERPNSAPAVDTAAPTTTPSTTVAPPRTVSPPAPINPPVAQTPVSVEPGTVTSIESKPDCDGIGGDSLDGRTRGQRVADCVGGWVRSQTREVRDGLKRQADDFRAGIDRVGQGLQWLGGKLRRSE
jgi:hypothetical protein